MIDNTEIKQDEKGISLSGQVIEILPNAQFKVKLQNGSVVIAHTSGKMRKHKIRILLYDTVSIKISHSDVQNLNKSDRMVNARLEYRFKSEKKIASETNNA